MLRRLRPKMVKYADITEIFSGFDPGQCVLVYRVVWKQRIAVIFCGTDKCTEGMKGAIK